MLLLAFLLSSAFLQVLVAGVCQSCQQQCSCNNAGAAPAKPCIGYDSRYMASSIDEAMFSFPNLVSNQGKPLFDKSTPTPSSQESAFGMGGASGGMGIMSGPTPLEAGDVAPAGAAPPPPPGDVPSAGFAAASIQPQSASILPTAKTINRFTAPPQQGPCSSQECMACKLAIVDGFIGNSGSQEENEKDELFVTKVRLQQETGLSSGSCGSAENAPTPTTTTVRPKKEDKMRKENEKKVKQVVSILTTFGRKKRSIENSTYDNNSTQQQIMDALLGVTTQIGCDYRRGSALTSESRWTGLCNLCWQWRRLPEEYFPNYVNEVSCDRSDCGCLSGFGVCMPVTRVLNVLKNNGTRENPNWQQVTIDTVAACECQVDINNPIHPFVAK